MKDDTRLILWIDLIVLLILTVFVATGQWDLVIALFLALILLNYFDNWWSRHRS